MAKHGFKLPKIKGKGQNFKNFFGRESFFTRIVREESELKAKRKKRKLIGGQRISGIRQGRGR